MWAGLKTANNKKKLCELSEENDIYGILFDEGDVSDGKGKPVCL